MIRYITRTREFALDRAIAMTRSSGHRAVFRVADIFAEFLEAGGGKVDILLAARERALAQATGLGLASAHEIVAQATRFLNDEARKFPRDAGNESRPELRSREDTHPSVT